MPVTFDYPLEIVLLRRPLRGTRVAKSVLLDSWWKPICSLFLPSVGGGSIIDCYLAQTNHYLTQIKTEWLGLKRLSLLCACRLPWNVLKLVAHIALPICLGIILIITMIWFFAMAVVATFTKVGWSTFVHNMSFAFIYSCIYSISGGMIKRLLKLMILDNVGDQIFSDMVSTSHWKVLIGPYLYELKIFRDPDLWTDIDRGLRHTVGTSVILEGNEILDSPLDQTATFDMQSLQPRRLSNELVEHTGINPGQPRLERCKATNIDTRRDLISSVDTSDGTKQRTSMQGIPENNSTDCEVSDLIDVSDLSPALQDFPAFETSAFQLSVNGKDPSPRVHLAVSIVGFQMEPDIRKRLLCECEMRHLSDREHKDAIDIGFLKVGETWQVQEELDKIARDIIGSWPLYDTFDANCQDFALKFAARSAGRPLPSITSRRLIHLGRYIYLPLAILTIVSLCVYFTSELRGWEIVFVGWPCAESLAFLYANSWLMFDQVLRLKPGMQFENWVGTYWRKIPHQERKRKGLSRFIAVEQSARMFALWTYTLFNFAVFASLFCFFRALVWLPAIATQPLPDVAMDLVGLPRCQYSVPRLDTLFPRVPSGDILLHPTPQMRQYEYNMDWTTARLLWCGFDHPSAIWSPHAPGRNITIPQWQSVPFFQF